MQDASANGLGRVEVQGADDGELTITPQKSASRA